MYLPLSPLRRSRHPLARIASLVLGLALLALLLFFGLLVAGVLLIGGGVLLAWRYWTRTRRTTCAASPHGQMPNVLEGEFVVLPDERSTTH